jgi:3-hydroxyacyl-[acyl-carrier-protein] dehydratase
MMWKKSPSAVSRAADEQAVREPSAEAAAGHGAAPDGGPARETDMPAGGAPAGSTDAAAPLTPASAASGADARRTLGTADIARVMKLLPHRYPFLLVDRIIEMDTDVSAIGIKNVTINEPFFQGHFPNFPVMPGVLLIEGIAQTAGALCVANLGADYEPQLVYFMTIDRARFRRPVVPGDVVHYHVTKKRNRGRVWRFDGQAKVNGQIVAEAEVSAMIVDTAQASAAQSGGGGEP